MAGHCCQTQLHPRNHTDVHLCPVLPYELPVPLQRHTITADMWQRTASRLQQLQIVGGWEKREAKSLRGDVGASSGTLLLWIGIWPCEKAPRNWDKSLRTRLCLCDLVSGLVRKPNIQKNSIQGSQMASCPSDVNKKVMLTMCFSCFSVPVLKETKS
jgi:hypothetical protein